MGNEMMKVLYIERQSTYQTYQSSVDVNCVQLYIRLTVMYNIVHVDCETCVGILRLHRKN